MNKFKKLILEILVEKYSGQVELPATLSFSGTKVHKFNLLGRPRDGRGDLERYMGVDFTDHERMLAARAFDELKKDGFIQSTYEDIVDPENWVRITESGRSLLDRDLKDSIDLRLEKIGQHLVEIRKGMHEALESGRSDANRQAVGSARELIDQVLKLGAPGLQTRRERAKKIMGENCPRISKSDVNIIENVCNLLEVEHEKMINLAHSRTVPPLVDASQSVKAADRVLTMIFGVAERE